MKTFVFELPPPTNQTYKAVYSSRLKRTLFFMAYPAKKWLKKTKELINIKRSQARPEAFEFIYGPVEMYVTWFLKRERDIDGGIKLLIDAFEGTLIKNDSQIRILHVYKRFDKEKPRVEIEFDLIISPKDPLKIGETSEGRALE